MYTRFCLLTASICFIGLNSSHSVAGTVSGNVNLAKSQSRDKRPLHAPGFVVRSENSIRPAKRLDPRPDMVVVLQTAETNKAPPAQGKKSSYRIIGESFENRIKPVQIGTDIEIVNKSNHTLQLSAPSDPNFVPSDPINPKGRRKTTTIAKHSKSILVQALKKPHLNGRVVAFPHPYFSTVKNGKFSISNVPAGLWKVTLWHEDGYVSLPKPIKINVASKPTTVDVQVPARLTKSK